MGPAPLRAILDANVLFPFTLRDTPATGPHPANPRVRPKTHEVPPSGGCA